MFEMNDDGNEELADWKDVIIHLISLSVDSPDEP